MDEFTRRQLLKGGGMLAVGLMAPPWLSAIARADIVKQAKGGKVSPDNVLVVCQLSGGNDGLNTFVPVNDPTYYDLRPTLGIARDAALATDAGIGFHPALAALHGLYKQGKVAVIQGVGYPNSSRSHFKSMEIWQSASPDSRLKYGWLGRHFDLRLDEGDFNSVSAVGLSVDKPRALNAKRASIPCFASLADIQAMVGDPDAERMLREIQGMDAPEGTSTRAIQQANTSALDAMTTLQSRISKFEPKQQYGDSPFGRGFRQIAQLVATSPETRVIYFSAGGFDTHAQQAGRHEQLLKGFSDAVSAFQSEIEAIGKADKVIVLVFSEFGRRAYENGSAGTDHGTGGPMMLIGKNVKGGFHGPMPDLQNLVNGDVAWKVDFRQVYAAALDDWMGSSSQVVLGERFAPMGLVKA